MGTREDFLKNCVTIGKQHGRITKLLMRCKKITSDDISGGIEIIDEIEMEVDCYNRNLKFSRTKKGGK